MGIAFANVFALDVDIKFKGFIMALFRSVGLGESLNLLVSARAIFLFVLIFQAVVV